MYVGVGKDTPMTWVPWGFREMTTFAVSTSPFLVIDVEGFG